MKNNKLIVGLILVGVGLLMLYKGYQEMQPNIVEKGFKFLDDFSKSIGEDLPVHYSRDKSAAYIMLIIGGVVSITGFSFILKSDKKD